MATLAPRLHAGGVRAVAVALLAVVVLASGCATSGLRRFPLAPIVWDDPDQRPFGPQPGRFYSSYMWDGADNAFFRPASEQFAFESPREAMNLNALDEVPDSSWFTNRLSRRRMTPLEMRDGACGDGFVIPTPWTIVGGKPDGSNPGFLIRDANGVRYLLKTEGTLQRFRAGAADAIGAALYHATGYHAPCNRVVTFSRDEVERDPDAMVERKNGDEEPLTEEAVEQVLAAAFRFPEGRYRAVVSRFIDGRPFGPWRYAGTREGDPNDVFPHQHRRETRGMVVLAAWLDHIDTRQDNTLAAWMSVGEDAGYVRHYMVDFGDCFGVLHHWPGLAERFGHSGYLDLEHVLQDTLSLGLIDRPWHRAAHGVSGRVFGHYDDRRFVPDQWRPGYPNPSFDRHTERDAAWMARMIARVGDEHLDALVGLGRFPHRLYSWELKRILAGRREKILERYLTRLSPLAGPTLQAGRNGRAEVCLEDLAVSSGIRGRRERRYAGRAWAGDQLAETDRPSLHRATGGRVCATLPALPFASRQRPAYLVLDLVAHTRGRETTGPARVHLYQLGDNAYRVVGLERPEPGAEAPRR